MTALCAGGSSSPKAGYAAILSYSLGLIATILEARGGRWLIPALPLLTLPPITLSSFCATDPPAAPTFTSAEATAILKLDVGSADFASGMSKVSDAVLNALWYEICQCDTGSPTAYAPPPPPSGTPIYQPPTSLVSTACYSNSFPPNNYVNNGAFQYARWNFHSSFPTMTSMRITIHQDISAGNPPPQWDVLLTGDAGVGIYLKRSYFGQWDLVIDVPRVPSATELVLNGIAGYSDSAFPGSLTILVEGFCGTGNLVNGDCCVDPGTAATLEAILRMVTLVQRQAAPFGYIPGTVHTGLTGQGTLTVQGLLGYTVELTTIPSYLGVTDESPDTIWEAGTTRWGTPDGWGSRRFVDAPTVFRPVQGDVTRIGYSLSPGVVATIREHLREP